MTSVARWCPCVLSLLLAGCDGGGDTSQPPAGGSGSSGGAASSTETPYRPAAGGGTSFQPDADWWVTQGLGNCDAGTSDAGAGGLWFATGDQAGSEPMRLLIAETGEFRWLPSAAGWWSQVSGRFEDLANNPATMDASWVEIKGLTILETAGYEVAVHAVRGQTGDLTVHYELPASPSFSGTQVLHTCRSLYERPSSMSLLAGAYVNYMDTLAIDETGAVFYQAGQGGCVGNGHAEPVDERFDMYRFEITLESCEGGFSPSLNGRTFSGLGYLGDSSGIAANDVLTFALSSAEGDRVLLWGMEARR